MRDGIRGNFSHVIRCPLPFVVFPIIADALWYTLNKLCRRLYWDFRLDNRGILI